MKRLYHELVKSEEKDKGVDRLERSRAKYQLFAESLMDYTIMVKGC